MSQKERNANNRRHAYRTEVVTAIAEKHFADKLECVRAANEILKAGGIAMRLGVCHLVIDVANGAHKLDHGNPRVEISIFDDSHGATGDTKFDTPATEADIAEFEACEPEMERLRDEWRTIKDAEDKEAYAKMQKKADERVPLDKAGLLAKVKEKLDEQEQYYVNQGPGKHGQEDYTGVQVVEMNVSLMLGWLDWDVECSTDYEGLMKADRREIWEASGFHFGINGYESADADHYWDHEEQ